MDLAGVLVQPKRAEFAAGDVAAGRIAPRWSGDGRPHRLVEAGMALVAERDGGDGPSLPLSLRIGAIPDDLPNGAPRDEAYVLDVRPDGIDLLAEAPQGALWACHTLRQMLVRRPGALPRVRVVDWPDLAHRGLFIESKWGPDLMTLDDWRTLVDRAAALKLNRLAVGLYSCWVVQYGGETTEFLMLPFPEHPALATPKTLRYYSPAKGEWTTLRYRPRMATDDFFGDLLRYGADRGMTVYPHFNGPGHSTLLPRVFPEIASKDERGRPIGYGYCLSNPTTYEILLGLHDRIVDRYLVPNGVDWFAIGVDEVEAYRGVTPEVPFAPLDPWCRCAACRERPKDELLQDYVVRVAGHLKRRGIATITIWDDGLRKAGGLDERFVAKLEAAGLRDNLVVQWWRYAEPALVPQVDLGLRAWSQPMAGYWSWLFTQSYTANIHSMLVKGVRAGAEGGIAYAIFDPAFDRNYACLAQWCWNQTTDDDLYRFKSRYARDLLGDSLGDALAVEAFDTYDQVFDATPWTETHLASLLYYWHTYPEARRRGHYPWTVLRDLLDSHMRERRALDRAAAAARSARDLFAAAEATRPDPLIAQHRVECEKLVGVWETWSLLLAAVEGYEAARDGEQRGAAALAAVAAAAASVTRAGERLRDVMADLERVKAPFLAPQILRDLSALLVFVDQLRDDFDGIRRRAEADPAFALPPVERLPAAALDPDPFVATDLGSTGPPPRGGGPVGAA